MLPDDAFGLIHGKAGVVTLADGRRTSFLGSANETGAAFRLNYELIWEDDAPEAVAWVQEEFDALWSSPHAVRLADFVIQDLDRLARRELVGEVSRWREEPDPASVVVEAPVYRKEVGLWEHQKHFVKLAFDAHRGPHGARFVLADQVGLGKTLQLAMAAQLMALVGDGPVLVLAPKALLQQWQDELDALLGLPSAMWDGRQWVDEHGVEHPGAGDESDPTLPAPRRHRLHGTDHTRLRRGGLAGGHALRVRHPGRSAPCPAPALSTGSGSAARNRTTCCASCSASRSARRACCSPPPRRCSFIPSRRSTCWRRWRRDRTRCWVRPAAAGASRKASLDLLLGKARCRPISTSVGTGCAIRCLRARKGGTSRCSAVRCRWRTRMPMLRAVRWTGCVRRTGSASKTGSAFRRARHNPYLRSIILRTREYLETTVDPETGEPYLTPVRVRLHGEAPADAIMLPPFLEDAYERAEEFCRLLGRRANAGLFRTMLLRRMGSTIAAGRLTVGRILDGWPGAR